MGVTLWIVLAFALGVLFGRLTARGAAGKMVGPTGMGAASGSGPGSGVQFGSTAPPVAMGNPGGAYRVSLLDRGPNLINTLKVVRDVTRLGLKDARIAVESTPRELIRVDSPEQAQAIARAFQGVASVRVDGPGEGMPAGYGYPPSDKL